MHACMSQWKGLVGSTGEQTSTAQMLDEALLSDQNVGTDVPIYLFHTPALRGVLKRHDSSFNISMFYCFVPILTEHNGPYTAAQT